MGRLFEVLSRVFVDKTVSPPFYRTLMELLCLSEFLTLFN
jgi:hypothetical protein